MRTINLPERGYIAAYSNDGSVLAVGGDRFSQLFDSATGERRAELEADCGPVFSVSFSCNDRTLATASDNSIRLWDANTGSLITKLEVDCGDRHPYVAFHPHIEHILVTYSGGCVWVWDINDTPRSTSFKVEGSAGCLCWLRTNRLQQRVLVGSQNGNMEMWEAELSQQAKVFIPPPSDKPSGHCRAVASSYDGSLVASGSDNGRVIVYSTNLGHSVYCCQLGGPVYCVAFSPTEQMLVWGSYSNSVRISYLEEDRVGLLNEHRSSVRSVAFSPDGQFLASTSDDHTLNVWETSAADPIALDEHHLKNIDLTRFLHHGNLLLTCSDDRTTKIWDTGTGALYATLEGRQEHAVVLSDGVHIVSLSFENTLTLWHRHQEEPLCTNTTLSTYNSCRVFPYFHHTLSLGFISIHNKPINDIWVVCCWAVEPMHADGPRLFPIARGTIPFWPNITQITHTGSMEKDDLRLIVELEEGKIFSASWNNPVVFSERLQELHFVEDHRQSLVKKAPSPLTTEIVARTSESGAWILNEHDERVLWLAPRNQAHPYGFRPISWYGQKLAVGGGSGWVTLVDFSNVNENKD
jgi:WD40 repeat protein